MPLLKKVDHTPYLDCRIPRGFRQKFFRIRPGSIWQCPRCNSRFTLTEEVAYIDAWPVYRWLLEEEKEEGTA